MLTALAIAASIAAGPFIEKVAIKPDLAANSTASWKVTVKTTAPEEHEATFTLARTLTKVEPAKPIPTTFEWRELTVDGNTLGEDSKWDAVIDERGGVVSSKDGDEIRMMLAPFVFVYPDKEVDTGDKWTVEPALTDKSAIKAMYVYEVKGTEKVKDKEAFKVACKMTTAKDGLSSTGTWWVTKEGKVLKFELELKNWTVPMAQSTPFDAHVTAEVK
jgi:hypothetical protein